jgi:hypothetical protein
MVATVSICPTFRCKRQPGGTCEVVLPHNFILVNTIFEVSSANSLVTAYANKHPSCEFLNEPSGAGLSQRYFPEAASVDSTLEAQEAWDGLHCSYSVRLGSRMLVLTSQ